MYQPILFHKDKEDYIIFIYDYVTGWEGGSGGKVNALRA